MENVIIKQESGKSRVSVELPMKNSRVFNSMRLPLFAAKSCFFREDAKMDNVYDWIE